VEATRLRELAEADGPFASLCFEDSHDTADAEKQLELKWREMRESLAEQGTDEATLGALDQAISQGPRPTGRSGRALVAAHGRVLVDEELTLPPPRPEARVSPSPYVLPLLRYGRDDPPYVLAVADSLGAELYAVDQNGNTVEQRSVDGDEEPVHKVGGGGMAHRRIQAGVEENVQHNLSDVAGEVAALAKRVGARLVLLAGEVQARKALHDALPEGVRGDVAELEHVGRRDQSADLRDELHDEIGRALAESQAAVRAEVIERFRMESGRDGGLAVQGVQATASALRAANVAVLLLDDPGESRVFVGSGPQEVAGRRAELDATGEAVNGERAADEALPLAALATGAQLLSVDGELELHEGCGAILRHN
jgi:hypothetical protein